MAKNDWVILLGALGLAALVIGATAQTGKVRTFSTTPGTCGQCGGN